MSSEHRHQKTRLCFVTSTRADWGILSPLAAAMRDDPDIELLILATNMHLIERFGNTADEILAAGFRIDAAVKISDPAEVASDPNLGAAIAMAQCLEGCAREFHRLCPDAVVILGDRFEMLAVVAAATVMKIPVIHISGGEITGGAIDDNIRHAISKLASLHLVSAEPYRQRVIQMGEQPDTVVNTGSLGVWNMVNKPVMPLEALASDIGFDIHKPFAVVTFHPATLDSAAPAERARELFNALRRFPQFQYIVTYPNNDPGSEEIIKEINLAAADPSLSIYIVKSLGLERYLCAIRHAAFVIGNSSSGIIEVPAVGTPVVNIGIRQKGRLHGSAVIDCGDSADEIAVAIKKAVDPKFRDVVKDAENPYFAPDTLARSVKAIKSFVASLPAPPKKFFDVPLL